MMNKILMLFLLFSGSITAQHFNPIIPDNVADPSISKFGDTYYLYGTTDIDEGLSIAGPPVVWKSNDFVNWSFEGSLMEGVEWDKPYVFTNKEGKQTYGYFRYWAPGRAVKKGELYYLFPTIVSPDGEGPVYVLVSESPEGPFRFLNGDGLFFDALPTGKKNSIPIVPDIDVEPFIDDDGSVYMYWRRRMAARISDDLSKMEGEPVSIPTKRGGYSEGPVIFKRENIYYYVYTLSGNQNYCNAYMMSKKGPLTGFEAPAGDDIFIYSSVENDVWGPGHGNVFFDEDSGSWIFVYLEYGEGGTTRQVFADRMEFNPDGTIKTIVPGREGVGFLHNTPDKRINLALNASVTASSCKEEKRKEVQIETNPNTPAPEKGSEVTAARLFTYLAENAIDGSNGTRWVASEKDKNPSLTLDFKEVTKIDNCEMAFTLPALGHAWVLEKSIDGKIWEVCGIQDTPVARSPHIANGIGETRYLRVKILKGNPGLWEIKVFD